jgi:hypothetical protein
LRKTSEARAAYQREYRAKKAVEPERPVPPVEAESRLHRDRVPKRGWHNPYDDGLPDWPELIQNLTQHQRDEILEKMRTR